MPTKRRGWFRWGSRKGAGKGAHPTPTAPRPNAFELFQDFKRYHASSAFDVLGTDAIQRRLDGIFRGQTLARQRALNRGMWDAFDKGEKSFERDLVEWVLNNPADFQRIAQRLPEFGWGFGDAIRRHGGAAKWFAAFENREQVKQFLSGLGRKNHLAFVRGLGKAEWNVLNARVREASGTGLKIRGRYAGFWRSLKGGDTLAARFANLREGFQEMASKPIGGSGVPFQMLSELARQPRGSDLLTAMGRQRFMSDAILGSLMAARQRFTPGTFERAFVAWAAREPKALQRIVKAWPAFGKRFGVKNGRAPTAEQLERALGARRIEAIPTLQSSQAAKPAAGLPAQASPLPARAPKQPKPTTRTTAPRPAPAATQPPQPRPVPAHTPPQPKPATKTPTTPAPQAAPPPVQPRARSRLRSWFAEKFKRKPKAPDQRAGWAAQIRDAVRGAKEPSTRFGLLARAAENVEGLQGLNALSQRANRALDRELAGALFRGAGSGDFEAALADWLVKDEQGYRNICHAWPDFPTHVGRALAGNRVAANQFRVRLVTGNAPRHHLQKLLNATGTTRKFLKGLGQVDKRVRREFEAFLTLRG